MIKHLTYLVNLSICSIAYYFDKFKNSCRILKKQQVIVDFLLFSLTGKHDSHPRQSSCLHNLKTQHFPRYHLLHTLIHNKTSKTIFIAVDYLLLTQLSQYHPANNSPKEAFGAPFWFQVPNTNTILLQKLSVLE